MTRFHSLMTAALVAALLANGGAVHAQGPSGVGPAGPDRAHGRLGRPGARAGAIGLPLRVLELTDDQEAQVKVIRDTHRESMQSAQDRLRNAIAAQRETVVAVPLNEGLIRSTTGELAAAQTEVAIMAARMRSEVLAALTPAQQEKLDTIRADRAKRLSERGQRRP